MDSFEEGYKYFEEKLANEGSVIYYNLNNKADYINRVNDTVKYAKQNILDVHDKYKNNLLPSKMGFIFEATHTGTYNVNKSQSGSNSYDLAYNIPVDGTYKGPDIVLNEFKDGKLDKQTFFSAKVYKNSKETMKAQMGYAEQKRLVPSDHLEDSKNLAHKRMLKNEKTRPEVSKQYKEIENNLVDRIEDSKGISSNPMSREELKDFTKDLKKNGKKTNFKKVGIKNKDEYKIIIENSIKAGISAAELSLLINATPKLVNFIIDYYVRMNDIDKEDLKKMGIDTLQNTGKAFISGATTSFITYLCQTKKLGKKLVDASPEVIGTIVVLTIDTIFDAIKVVRKAKTNKELINDLIKRSYILLVSSGMMKVAELIPYLKKIPAVAKLIGGMVGTVIGMYTYDLIGEKVISFVVESGVTLFGLFEQDYTLPDSAFKEMGIDIFELEKFENNEIEIDQFNFDKFEVDEMNYDQIEMVYLRRGVIGVNKIGYV